MMKEIPIKSSARKQFIEVTSEVEKAVSESAVKEGICIVYCPHTTAAVTINEGADPSVVEDVMKKLNEIAPEGAGYAHAEGNSDSHIKSTLVGRSELIPVKNGELVLGNWGSVFFTEFDGPRSRKLIVQILGK